MHSARIVELLEPFFGPPNDRRLTTGDYKLTTDDLDTISTYIDLLLRWNARINLTAIRDPEQIIPRHFGESFFLARHLFPERVERTTPPASSPESLATGHWPPTSVLDLGSGAGFPALPLKIWAPEIHLTLIESNHKKAAFLREVIRALRFTNVDVIAARAEDVLRCLRNQPPGFDHPARDSLNSLPLSPADIVTFRAVERFDRILPLAVGFLAPRGRLALLIGSSQLPALQTVPLKWEEKHIPQSHGRVLVIGLHR